MKILSAIAMAFSLGACVSSESGAPICASNSMVYNQSYEMDIHIAYDGFEASSAVIDVCPNIEAEVDLSSLPESEASSFWNTIRSWRDLQQGLGPMTGRARVTAIVHPANQEIGVARIAISEVSTLYPASPSPAAEATLLGERPKQ